MSALLGLLGPLLPYLLMLLGGIAAYFAVKQKGKVEERAKQEAAKQEVVAQVNEAVSGDTVVDAKVEAKREEIKKSTAALPSDGDGSVFKF